MVRVLWSVHSAGRLGTWFSLWQSQGTSLGSISTWNCSGWSCLGFSLEWSLVKLRIVSMRNQFKIWEAKRPLFSSAYSYSLYTCTPTRAIISQLCMNVILLPCVGAFPQDWSAHCPELGVLMAHSSQHSLTTQWSPFPYGTCLPTGSSSPGPMPGVCPNWDNSPKHSHSTGTGLGQSASHPTGMILKALPTNLLQVNLPLESTLPESIVQLTSRTNTICYNLLPILVASFCFFFLASSSLSLVLYTHMSPTDGPLPRKHMFTTCSLFSCIFLYSLSPLQKPPVVEGTCSFLCQWERTRFPSSTSK